MGHINLQPVLDRRQPFFAKEINEEDRMDPKYQQHSYSKSSLPPSRRPDYNNRRNKDGSRYYGRYKYKNTKPRKTSYILRYDPRNPGFDPGILPTNDPDKTKAKYDRDRNLEIVKIRDQFRSRNSDYKERNEAFNEMMRSGNYEGYIPDMPPRTYSDRISGGYDPFRRRNYDPRFRGVGPRFHIHDPRFSDHDLRHHDYDDSDYNDNFEQYRYDDLGDYYYWDGKEGIYGSYVSSSISTGFVYFGARCAHYVLENKDVLVY